MGITPFSQPHTKGHLRRNKVNKRFKKGSIYKILYIKKPMPHVKIFLGSWLRLRQRQKIEASTKKAKGFINPFSFLSCHFRVCFLVFFN